MESNKEIVKLEEFEFSEEVLKTYIPTIMVELPGEMEDKAAEKYGLKVKNGNDSTNQ